jgi:hypothetical protein
MRRKLADAHATGAQIAAVIKGYNGGMVFRALLEKIWVDAVTL